MTHRHINEQVDELRDRVAALELRVQFFEGDNFRREHVRQMPIEEIAKLEERGKARFPREWMGEDCKE